MSITIDSNITCIYNWQYCNLYTYYLTTINISIYFSSSTVLPTSIGIDVYQHYLNCFKNLSKVYYVQTTTVDSSTRIPFIILSPVCLQNFSSESKSCKRKYLLLCIISPRFFYFLLRDRKQNFNFIQI